LRLPPRSLRPVRSVVLASLFLLASEANAVIFDDGGVHRIDGTNSFPAEGVAVADGPGGAPTTVRIASGGEVATELCAGTGFCKGLTVSGSSLVEVRGGEISGLTEVEDDARLAVSGGQLESVRMRNRSSVELSAGLLGHLHVRDGRRVLITGGEIRDFLAEGNRTSVLVTGGDFSPVSVGSATRVTIVGGAFHDGVRAADSAQVAIAGGSFARALVASGKAHLAVLGTSFNFPFGDIIVALAGRLEGELATGADLGVGFERDASASLTLVFAELDEGFEDTDGDGEHDMTDYCPQTAEGADVDTAGCSGAQFCAALDVATPDDLEACRLADWKNNESTEDPRDCRILRVGPLDLECAVTPTVD